MSDFSTGICNDKWQAVPRQPDADIFYIHCTGGFRGTKISDDHWQIEPIFENGEARAKGFLTDKQLRQIVRIGGFKVLGFQASGWLNGEWHSSWRPIIPTEKNHARSPSAIWGSISTNLFSATRAQQLTELKEPDHSKVATILDDSSVEERLARAISFSLRSMDLAVEQIAEHYNEQLVNKMYAGKVDGQRSSNTMDQNLFAHVHAFFLQLGSARDYLAAFIANRLGMNASHGKVDTMNALKSKLRSHHAGSEPILDLFLQKKWLMAKPDEPDRWATSGWLKEVTDLRNEIVHRRPYGSVYAERFGWAKPVRADLGLYRYFRPIEIEGQPERDLLDLICYHYRECTGIFFDAAKAAGLDGNMMSLTDKEIVSLKVIHPPTADQ
ncbi:hypothetical protein [Shimia marina]|uniref:Uncharacterized protein n=1 Tax=Shimia marina TaxID=321267 RepID=A0A0P1EV52_9RHOB|nr:hypothetical protein [Shimia marina]CUH54025.1 hypothetical protein SHM7688_03494 [Shimia marina]SFE16550.1 hypothetical protein SAMN04488037_10617 [Shimia marina]